ncbi:hypothetical protein ACJX0J_020948, partial [Zea mays]
ESFVANITNFLSNTQIARMNLQTRVHVSRERILPLDVMAAQGCVSGVTDIWMEFLISLHYFHVSGGGGTSLPKMGKYAEILHQKIIPISISIHNIKERIIFQSVDLQNHVNEKVLLHLNTLWHLKTK